MTLRKSTIGRILKQGLALAARTTAMREGMRWDREPWPRLAAPSREHQDDLSSAGKNKPRHLAVPGPCVQA